jgi:hypothetical protein
MGTLSFGRVALFVCLALLFGMVLAGCGPTPTPTCAPEEHVQAVLLSDIDWDCPPWSAQIVIEGFEFEGEPPIYVKNQVVVTGRRDDVEAVVGQVLVKGGRIGEEPIVLDWLPADVSLRFFPEEARGPVIIALYDTGDITAEVAVAEIYNAAIESGTAVFPDLNLVTGHPHIVAGSPHIVAGSPFGPVGGGERAFESQWALGEPPGVEVTSLDEDLITVPPTGYAVRVGVFDTSPFEESGAWEVSWMTDTMRLCVSNLLTSPEHQTPTSDHGLFVSGLVHVVAPKSEIHLIQVLNRDALGDLNTLNSALNKFIHHRLEEQGGNGYKGPLTDTVINLSLGFPQARQRDDLGMMIRELHYNLMDKVAPNNRFAFEDDILPVVSLATILSGAVENGVTVVAAAGNASEPGQPPEPAEIPAAYPFVIGVAASNRDGDRACYSNEGDMTAPGGDSDSEKDRCGDVFTNTCERAMIGPVLNTSPCSGYACWTGTSFSAPLVSGLAALILQNCSGSMAPAVVSETIATTDAFMADPHLGKGIVNVPDSLECPP